MLGNIVQLRRQLILYYSLVYDEVLLNLSIITTSLQRCLPIAGTACDNGCSSTCPAYVKLQCYFLYSN